MGEATLKKLSKAITGRQTELQQMIESLCEAALCVGGGSDAEVVMLPRHRGAAQRYFDVTWAKPIRHRMAIEAEPVDRRD